MNTAFETDLTVASLVEKDGRILTIDEHSSGSVVINQPGGHIEAGETPEAATIRETLEESGCHITINEMLGVYLWQNPLKQKQYLRIVYTATLVEQDLSLPLDTGIVQVRWLTPAELQANRKRLRSPLVLSCVDDYLKGQRQPLDQLKALHPIQQNVEQVLATARQI